MSITDFIRKQKELYKERNSVEFRQAESRMRAKELETERAKLKALKEENKLKDDLKTTKAELKRESNPLIYGAMDQLRERLKSRGKTSKVSGKKRGVKPLQNTGVFSGAFDSGGSSFGSLGKSPFSLDNKVKTPRKKSRDIVIRIGR